MSVQNELGRYAGSTAISSPASTDKVFLFDVSGNTLGFTTVDDLKSTSGSGSFTTIAVSSTSAFTGAATFSAPSVYDANTTITAFATGGQGSATALTGEFNNVTTVATAFDSVKLLTAAAGQTQTVKNSGAAILSVFPNTSDSINALAINLSVDIPVGGQVTFRAISDTVWETQESFYSTAPTTQTGGFAFKAADNGSNVDVTLTNASHGQATAVTIPDSGLATSYVAQSTAALTATEVDILDGAVFTTAEANRALDLSTRIVALTATDAITEAEHEGKDLYVTGTALATYTLPEATGGGGRYRFIIGEVNTNNTVIVVADTTNANFIGSVNILDLDASAQGGFGSPANSDTITLNGTTTGGAIGDTIELIDVATDVWMVVGQLQVPTGSNIATPFSAAV